MNSKLFHTLTARLFNTFMNNDTSGIEDEYSTPKKIFWFIVMPTILFPKKYVNFAKKFIKTYKTACQLIKDVKRNDGKETIEITCEFNSDDCDQDLLGKMGAGILVDIIANKLEENKKICEINVKDCCDNTNNEIHDALLAAHKKGRFNNIPIFIDDNPNLQSEINKISSNEHKINNKASNKSNHSFKKPEYDKIEKEKIVYESSKFNKAYESILNIREEKAKTHVGFFQSILSLKVEDKKSADQKPSEIKTDVQEKNLDLKNIDIKIDNKVENKKSHANQKSFGANESRGQVGLFQSTLNTIKTAAQKFCSSEIFWCQ